MMEEDSPFLVSAATPTRTSAAAEDDVPDEARVFSCWIAPPLDY